MKKIIRTAIIILALAAVLGPLSGCQDQPADQPMPEIRIAFFPNITHPQALYGRNTGLFESEFGENASIKWVQFSSGPTEIEAMLAGEIDIGYVGIIPAINGAIVSNGDIQVLAGASSAGAVLVTRADLVLTSVDQLDGLRIAVPQLGNTQHISLLAILKESGLETSDRGGTVELIASSNADTMMLLDRGEIDAALVPEPWGARMVNEIGANIFLDEKEVFWNGDYPSAVIVVTREFMEENPELVETFLRVHLEITDLINSDEAAKNVINKELFLLTGKYLEQETLEQAFERVVITTDVNMDAITEFIAILEEINYISGTGTAEDVVDSTLLEAIIEEELSNG